MRLVDEIYEFFNEGRPRTKNIGVEDIPRPGSGKSQRDPDIEDVGKKVSSRVNVNPEGEKSVYKPGSVHEIRFNNITKGVTQKVYTIYRNLSESDYRTLKGQSSPKVVTLVTPSSNTAHDFDVYYITIPKVKYGLRKGADYTYFVYLRKDMVESLTAEQKQKIKLELVPIKDIADGLDKRPLDLYTLMTFLSDKQKERVKKEKPAVKPAPKQSDDDADVLDIDLNLLLGDDEEELEFEPEEPEKPSEDSPQEKAAKQKAAEFMLDDKIDRIFSQIIKEFNVYAAPGSQKERMDAKEKMSNYIERFIDNLFDMIDSKLERKAVIEYNVATKLEKKQGLYKLIKIAYDNMESIKESAKKTMKEQSGSNKYAIELVPGSQTDKLFADKKVPKVFGQQHTYIRKLTDQQAFQLEKLEDVISVKPIDQDTKGYIKPSSSFKAKERGVVTFDPNNPDHIKKLSGKVKPGENLYSVTIKMDKGSSRDVLMPLSQIEKMLPDYKLEPGIEQPFEKDMFRAVSSQTGDTIYDKVKGTLKFKTGKPIDQSTTATADDAPKTPITHYVVNVADKKLVKGFRSEKEAKDYAEEIGGYPNIAIIKSNLGKYGISTIKREGVDEAMSQEDKDKLMGMRVSFTIQSDLDPDKQYNISDNVKSIKDEKDKFIIDLTQAGTLTFDKMGTGIFKYSKDNKDYQALNVPADLMSVVKKSFEPAKKEAEPESALEVYIRKRIKEALKEAEISQYWGYQGKDVKKKRLEEYMKKYHWGFQTSDNPYEHSVGSEIHGVVTKLVHELGDEGLAIFNSYAPKGFEVADMSELDQMSDTPLGSQLTQPYNPDSLTARGGRVAEEDNKVSTGATRAIQAINDKYKDVESLAKGYNSKDSLIMTSPSAKSVVQKAIAKAYGSNPSKAGPELKKAFMSMSDEDLKKSK